MLSLRLVVVSLRLSVFIFLLFFANLTSAALLCTETPADMHASLLWAGASPNDVSTLNGSTSTPGHLQGRLRQCIPDGSVEGEVGTFEWLPPQAGDDAYFVGEINGPNSVALNGPDFNFVSIRMGNANFTGGLNAKSVVIQDSQDFSKMNFNGVSVFAQDSILIDSSDGEESPDIDLTLKFDGGGLAATKDINIGAFGRATTDLTMNGSILTADTLGIQPAFDGGGTVNMKLHGGSSSVSKDVMIGAVEGGQTYLTIDQGADVSWAINSGFTTIGHSGNVDLEVKGGADLKTHETFIGFQPETHITIKIEDAKWTTGNLVVGGFGKVDVTANSGTELSSLNTTIGSFNNFDTIDGAVVTLNDDAKWDIDGFLSIGSEGKGKLVLNDDSTVDVSGPAIIGVLEHSDGALEVNSGNTFNAHTTLEIGRSGNGDMTIGDGGHTDVSGDMFLGTFQQGNGSVTVKDGGLLTVDGNLNIGNGTPGVADFNNGTGNLVIENGGTVEFGGDKELRVGRREGSIGHLTLVGPNSQLVGGDSVNQSILVGLDGEGFLTLDDGAKITGGETQDFTFGINEKGTGHFLIRSDGSLLKTNNLILGDKGLGEGFVSDGGKVEVEGSMTIGKISEGDNKLYMLGDGTILEVGQELTIGDEGKGTLELSSGAKLDMQGSNSKVTLGKKANSDGTLILNGSGEHLASDTEITIGDEGSGKLSLQDGAQLKMGDVTLGDKQGSIGRVDIKGTGSLFEVENSLTVSKDGGGVILVTEGGAMKTSTADPSAKIVLASKDNSPTALIRVEGQGSLWEASGDIILGQKANGVLTVSDGGKVDAKKNLVLGEEEGGFGQLNIGGPVDEDTGSPAEVFYNELTIGKNGSGEVIVSKGGKFTGKNVTTGIFLGEEANTSGKILVKDEGSKWTVDSTQDLALGVHGSGEITVENGGLVEMDPDSILVLGTLSAGSKGTIVVDAIGEGALASRFLTGSEVVIGRLGEGRVDILNGAEFKGASDVDVVTEVGTLAGGKGIVNVEGEDSIWAPGDVTIGGDGSAQVTVKDLAIVNSNNVVIKGNTANETAVTVHNAKWDLFNFDMQGDSRLDIEGIDGVSTFTVHGDTTIRSTGAGSSLVTLDGTFAQYDASNSDILLDHATMLVNGGARVNAANMTIDGPGLFQLKNNSLAEISNKMIVNNGLAQVAAGSVMNVEKNLQIGTLGTVDVAQGGVVNVGFENIGTPDNAVSVGSGGTLSGSGTIKGNLFVGGETQPGFGNGGKVLPGNSPGKLTVEGNFFLGTGAILGLEMAGTQAGFFDQLAVSGLAEFAPGSIVEFSFLDGYLPKAGDQFSFINAQGGVAGLSSDNFKFTGIEPSFIYDAKFEDGRFTLAALNDAQPVVPEPATMALMLPGLAGMFWSRRKKASKS